MTSTPAAPPGGEREAQTPTWAVATTSPAWATLRELDHEAGLAKGSAFRAFKACRDAFVEGEHFLCRDARTAPAEVEALAVRGRLHPGTVTAVLLGPALAAAVRERLRGQAGSPAARPRARGGGYNPAATITRGECAMTVEDLLELEQIKQLKARYFRHMDTRQWQEWATCFTADVVAVYDGPPRLGKRDDPTQVACHGRESLVAAVSGLFVEASSIHQGYMPELELTSATSARGIWSMFDYIRSPRGTFKGWGHYHEEYVKQDGQWKIKSIKLTRLHVEETWSGI